MTQTLTPTDPPTSIALGTRSEAVEAMASRNFKIAGDVIAAAVRELTEAQASSIRWFAGYCRARNLSNEEIAGLLAKPGSADGTYSWASIYAVFTGRRQEQGASVEPVVKAIEVFRRQVEAKGRAGDSGFIATRMSRAIASRCDRVRKRQKVGFLFGPSQIGKTESLVAYANANNHGQTIYVEAPTGGTVGAFVEELSLVLAVPQIHRVGDRHARVIKCFSPGMLLIIDEAHRFLHTRRGLLALDFIRELYNRARCGIMLSMTEEGRGFFEGKTALVRLKQLWNRRLAPLVLPKTVPDDDLSLFAAAYDLDPAPAGEIKVRTKFTDEHGAVRERDFTAVPRVIQQKVVGEEGLGVWLTILQDAKDMAAEQRRCSSWGAVLKAYCISQADEEVWA